MISDNYEQECEFERLAEMLTGEGSSDLVVRIHDDQEQFDGHSKLLHVYAVAEQAATHAAAHYADSNYHAQRYNVVVCRLAGLLHETMEWGVTFEELVDVADERVAQTVAAITPDCRLPRPKRQKVQINRVGLTDTNGQIVKLADLQHDCFRLLGLTDKQFTDAVLSDVRSWVDDARELLPVLCKINECEFLAPQLDDLRDKVGQLRYRCEELQRRRSKRKGR